MTISDISISPSLGRGNSRTVRTLGKQQVNNRPPSDIAADECERFVRSGVAVRTTLGLVRDVYQDQLDALAAKLADMCDLVADALDKATRALLQADLELAERVISDDTRVDELRTAAEEHTFALLVLQAPVATDLRITVSGIHAASDIERMGDLAVHIAKTARRRHPNLVMPDDVAPYLAEMGRVGSRLARKAGEVIRTRDLARAGELEADDDAMDDLHRHLFTLLTGPSWDHGVCPAIDITLIGRFYERYADHAVALARRVIYIVTGRMPSPVA
jgi:phosphate transport system protein